MAFLLYGHNFVVFFIYLHFELVNFVFFLLKLISSAPYIHSVHQHIFTEHVSLSEDPVEIKDNGSTMGRINHNILELCIGEI